ncbi:MAG: hypothetical protein ACXABY_17095 [Candidatus Thorarchaeota archaeon]
MNVLLIWEDVPENTRVFLLKDLPTEDVDLLKIAAGKFVNGNDHGPAGRVQTRIENHTWKGMPDPEAVGIWAKYKIINLHGDQNPLAVPSVKVDLVVVSGFIL